MQTRSSVLGKRSHHADVKQASLAPHESACPLSMPTPEPTPKSKRPRVSLSLLDGDCNKENVPPFRNEAGAPPSTLRRTSSEIITPSRISSTASRYATISTLPASPATSVSVLALGTPPSTPHSTLSPLYARARALLRATCNGSSPIAGRATERAAVTQFISCSWENSSNSSLFISGTPGTGKTALVNAVLNEVGDDCDIDVISINCMAFQNLDALWDHLLDALAPSERVKASPRKARSKGKPLLDELLISKKRKCLLVLDELDHIATSSQTLSSIFSLSRKYVAVLRIVAIANTHTLTASTTLLGDDAAGISTLHFGGYTSSQLLEVLRARLSPLLAGDSEGSQDPEAQVQAQKFLPAATLTLLAKKVASQTGDVRMLFGVLRGAIDLAVSSATSSEDNPLVMPMLIVTPNHVLAALKAYLPSKDTSRQGTSVSTSTFVSISEIATKVRGLGLQARLVLLSMLLALKRMEALLPLSYSPLSPPKTPVKRAGSASQVSKSTGLDLAQLHTYYSAILDRAENGVFASVCRSEFADLIGVLETSGLVSSSASGSLTASPSKSGRRGFGRSASFAGTGKPGQDIRIVDTVRTDEILRGLGVAEGDTELTDPREEEIRAIWIRETTRIMKDVKARPQSKRTLDDTIEGAFER